MKSLKSNGIGSDGEWMGVDTKLEYPGVDTCVTVTCLVGTKLVGCHLFASWKFSFQTDHHNKCVSDFAKAAKKLGPIKAMYIIGNVGYWGNHISTLAEKMKTTLGYLGAIGGSNPPICTGNITVTLKGPVALEFTREGIKIELTLLDV